jgi:hypothetical protein
MFLRNVEDIENKEKRMKERVKAAKKVAVGIGVLSVIVVLLDIAITRKSKKKGREDMKNAISTVETINNTIQENADNLKNSAAHASKEVCNIINDVSKKTEGVKKDIKDGYNEIAQDFIDAAENISKDIK